MASSPLSDVPNIPPGTSVSGIPPGTTITRPSNQPEWVILAFIVGAVVLGMAGLLTPAADVATRHDCYNLATVLGSAAAGGYAAGRAKPSTP